MKEITVQNAIDDLAEIMSLPTYPNGKGKSWRSGERLMIRTDHIPYDEVLFRLQAYFTGRRLADGACDVVKYGANYTLVRFKTGVRKNGLRQNHRA